MKKLARDLWVIILDLIAVNLSYYMALLVRFYVNSEFRPTVSYLLTDFYHFAPWYSICSIIIFAAWRLYDGMWRYAGINDMNRIIGANICTTVIQVLGSTIFIRRMPYTYYVIGAVLQFVMVSIIRFSYRLLLVEKKKLSRSERIDCLVVGSGDLGRKVVNHLEDGGSYRTIAIAGTDAGRMLNGIPVIPISSIREYVDEKKIKALFIADPLLTDESRDSIKQIVNEKKLSIQDYTGYQANMTGRIPLTALMSVATGAITVIENGQKKHYENAEEVLKAATVKMDVKKIVSPVIELEKAEESGWNTWVENYRAAIGQDVDVL